ncbi:MAG TPA: DNA starvation/stationary phase protection protein Dps [Myxococcota bacterium]|nr:DNA starvation/stationary phase protection protein Dps [Myxococcota bacterium]
MHEERRMNPTKNDMSRDLRGKMVKLLSDRLVDTIDLFNQLKQAHWNVKGPSFIAIHELFDQIAEHAEEWSDDIAERAVQMGGMVDGTAQAVAQRTTLEPYDASITDGLAHVDAIAAALARYGQQVRKAIDAADKAGDAGTTDLFTQVSRAVDKDLWFVEAHLQNAEPDTAHASDKAPNGKQLPNGKVSSKAAPTAGRAKNRHALS